MPSPAYRALSGYQSGSTTAATRTLGLEFSVTEFSWLSTIWFYRPSTAVPLPTAAGLWTVTPGASASATTGAAVAGSSAVTWVATSDQTGWIPGVLANPVLLAPGLIFRVGALVATTVPAQANYYSTGLGKDGFSSGPLRVPGSAAAVNNAQGVYNAGSTLTFPNTPGTANYGIDVTVEPDPDLIQGINECSNPAAGIDATGWYSPATIVGRVTGLSGMDRSTGYRASSSAFSLSVQAPMLPVVPGQTVSASLQALVTAAGNYRASVIFRTAAQAAIASATVNGPQVTLAAGEVYRPSSAIVATAPASAAYALILIACTDSTPPSGGQITATAVRYRYGSWPSLAYMDGDSPKWVWDSVAGSSTSRRNSRVWAADTDPSDDLDAWRNQGENECPNPSCAIDATGYTGYPTSGGSGGRATSLSGLDRSTGFRAVQGSTAGDLIVVFPYCPAGPGDTISLSPQVRLSAAASVKFSLIGMSASGTSIAGSGVEESASLTANAPYRPRAPLTITAPAGAVAVRLVVTVSAFAAAATAIFAAVRYRRGSWPSLPYLDGDSPKWRWAGSAGNSRSMRDPAALTAAPVATVGTSIGYTGTQRQDAAQVYASNPAGIPVEAAPFGRPGRATRVDIPTGYQRIEHNPTHREFASGEEYWFGFAFALAAGHPTWVDDFWVVEQLHGAPGQGSPVLGFEVRNYSLRLRGGDNRPVAGGGSSGSTYAYNQLLLSNLRVNRFYDVRYRVLFSDQPGGGSVDVYVDGAPRLLGFAPPCGTVYGPDTSSTEYGNSYRKQGVYKRPALEGGTIWHAGAALGTSYDAVNPARTQLVATSESMAPVMC